MIVEVDVVVDDGDETDSQVDSGDTSKADQGLLANFRPWRVADAEEDGLRDVRIDGDGEGEGGTMNLRVHLSCSWEEEP